MKHYVTMKLVIIRYKESDIITKSGDNEIMTDVSEYFGAFGS